MIIFLHWTVFRLRIKYALIEKLVKSYDQKIVNRNDQILFTKVSTKAALNRYKMKMSLIWLPERLSIDVLLEEVHLSERNLLKKNLAN